MKRILTMLCLLLSLWSFASAEEISRDARDIMLAAHPGCEIIAADHCGNVTAAALAQGERRILCVAEKYNGQWVLTIDNPNALLPGQTPSILMDTDISLYWTYDLPEENPVQLRFSSFKRNGVWDAVSCTLTETNGEGVIDETALCWRDDGVMWRLFSRYDWNENLLHQKRSAYVPAGWLAPHMPLATYDVNIVPRPNLNYTGTWLEEEYLALAAQELLPGYTYLNGYLDDAGLQLFMQAPDGAKVLVGVTSQGVTDDWRLAISSPLPEGAFYGYENFSNCLYIDGLLVAVTPYANGTWGVGTIWPEQAEDTIARLGQCWVSDSTASNAHRAIGSHPWSDIAAIDWTTLPRSLQEAIDCIDPDGWAVVNNPDPADRLHLRAKADRNSDSLGKYYNGTPVEVLHRGSTWTQVRVLGVEGWMMTKYLAFDSAALQVACAMPDLFLRDNEAIYRLYTSPNQSSANVMLPYGTDVAIIGLVGDEWYHVWLYWANQGGYMKQDAFWPGRGLCPLHSRLRALRPLRIPFM